jgi:hypothetical protein
VVCVTAKQQFKLVRWLDVINTEDNDHAFKFIRIRIILEENKKKSKAIPVTGREGL